MTSPAPLAGSSILVVEGKDRAASDVRSALLNLGAHVHVVGNAVAALTVVRAKRLHGAILDCVSHGAPLPLCNELATVGVPVMFYGGHSDTAATEVARNISELISLGHDRTVFAHSKQILGASEGCLDAVTQFATA